MKILIRLPNWLGDVVMSTAFIGAVRQLYPEARIDVIIKNELGGILSLIPGLDKIHLFSKKEYKGLSGVFRFGKTLRSEKYNLFFCLPDSLSSAVMGWATFAKKRVGFAKEGRSFLLTSGYKRPLNMHRVDEYLYLLEQFTGRKIPERAVSIPVKEATKKNIIVINFNSEASSRRMPVEDGRQLLNMLLDAFQTAKFAVIGSPKEREYADELLRGVANPGRIENYAGKTNLKELCNLMASASVVLTTDSGPAHLANGIGVPTIVLFGAGNEHNTAPYNKKDLTVLRAGKLECEPCVRNECKLYGVPKCMQLIEAKTIIDKLDFYLKHA